MFLVHPTASYRYCPPGPRLPFQPGCAASRALGQYQITSICLWWQKHIFPLTPIKSTKSAVYGTEIMLPTMKSADLPNSNRACARAGCLFRIREAYHIDTRTTRHTSALRRHVNMAGVQLLLSAIFVVMSTLFVFGESWSFNSSLAEVLYVSV